MFPLFICLFLVFGGQSLVSTASVGEVLEWTPDDRGYQMTFPSLKEAKFVYMGQWKAKSPSKSFVYDVECTVFEKRNPIVKIYKSQGVIIDTLILEDLGKDTPTCSKKNVEQYIIPEEEPEQGEISMIYLWRDKTCVNRKYKIKTLEFMALVDRGDYSTIVCPDSILEYLKEISSRDQQPGGVVRMAVSGRAHLMDYINNFYYPRTNTYLQFATLPEDRGATKFKFNCRRDSITTLPSILTGKLVYKDSYGEDIVLDKFKLKKSCSITNINVNRQYLDDSDHFKIVFKTAKGKCYKREYESFKDDSIHEFVVTTLVRKEATEVVCPETFTSGVGLTKYILSWWNTRIFKDTGSKGGAQIK